MKVWECCIYLQAFYTRGKLIRYLIIHLINVFWGENIWNDLFPPSALSRYPKNYNPAHTPSLPSRTSGSVSALYSCPDLGLNGYNLLISAVMHTICPGLGQGVTSIHPAASLQPATNWWDNKHNSTLIFSLLASIQSNCDDLE